MDPEKLIQLQQQMKINQVQTGDFLKDLDDWTSDIKKKEQELKELKPKDKSALPPVRNSLEQKKKKKKKKVKKADPASTDTTTTTKPKKIRSGDYRAWDKFDVDKALEDVDGQKESSPSESETDEEWEIERKKQQAVIFKDQGNQYFKEGKHDLAIECYTQGIDCDPENALLPCNRAMALIKKEMYAAAELDCSQALHLDPGYLKAFFRRATAREALKKYAEAKEDFLEVLSKEKGHKLAKAGLDRVENILNPPKILQSLSMEKDGVGIVTPINKPPNQRSKKPLRRIQIEEIGLDENEVKVPKASETKKKLEAKETAAFDEMMLQKENRLNDSGDNPESSNFKNKIQEIINEVMKTETKTESETKTETETKTESNGKEAGDSSPQTSPRVPALPTSSVQFLRDSKSLKDRPEDFYQYLKAIPCAKFPKLLSNAFEADTLMQILDALQHYYVPRKEDVFSVLDALSNVQRFDMTVLFLSAQQKEVISSLLTYCRDNSDGDKIQRLAKKYGVKC